MAKRRVWKNKPKAVRDTRRAQAAARRRNPDNYLENMARSMRRLQDTIGPATSGGMR